MQKNTLEFLPAFLIQTQKRALKAYEEKGAVQLLS